MISNRFSILGSRSIVYTLYELQLQTNNEFIITQNNNACEFKIKQSITIEVM